MLCERLRRRSLVAQGEVETASVFALESRRSLPAHQCISRVPAATGVRPGRPLVSCSMSLIARIMETAWNMAADRELAGERVDRARSALMSRVRGKNTKPELVVRREAHALGYRFRLHRSDLPGTPDLVFPRLHKVVFVHGCFWHRHEGCSRTTTPTTRAAYWQRKFEQNVQRDRRNVTMLEALGWKALVIWECETFDRSRLAESLSSFPASPM